MKRCKRCGANVPKLMSVPSGAGWFWGCEVCVATKKAEDAKHRRKQAADKRKAAQVEKAQLAGGPVASRLAVAALTAEGLSPSAWNHRVLSELLDGPPADWDAGLEPSNRPDRLTKCGLVELQGFDVLEWARRHVIDRQLKVALDQLRPAGEVPEPFTVTVPLPQGLVVPRGEGRKQKKHQSGQRDRTDVVRAGRGSLQYRGFAPLDANSPSICDISIGDFFEKGIAPRIFPTCVWTVETRLRTYGLVSDDVEACKVFGPFVDPRVEDVLAEVLLKAWRWNDRIYAEVKGDERSLERYLHAMAANTTNSWLRTHRFVPRNAKRDECRPRVVNGVKVCDSHATCVCVACRQEGTCWVQPLRYDWQLPPLSLDRDSDDDESLYGGIAALDGTPVASESLGLADGVLEALRSVPNYDLLVAHYAKVPDTDIAVKRRVTPAAIRQARSRAMLKVTAIAESFAFPHMRENSPTDPSSGDHAKHANDPELGRGAG
ncbi:MAG: hypothetical protein JWL76_1984 [Thermoleophilia bacterium]|nr:hypothetical protein [Thermoleophilia bacterium]